MPDVAIPLSLTLPTQHQIASASGIAKTTIHVIANPKGMAIRRRRPEHSEGSGKIPVISNKARNPLSHCFYLILCYTRMTTRITSCSPHTRNYNNP